MSYLSREDRIFVAGHKGLVGSAITRALQTRGYQNIVFADRRTLDLTETENVNRWFERERPDVVFLAAAKVGGIHANNTLRADFIYQNLQVQNNVIWAAHKYGTRRFVFLGSSCIYPRNAPQPMPETCLLTGPLESTNRPYAIAKIAGVELVQSLRAQFGRDYFSVMPTNLYGPGDNFDLESSHVLPAFIRKFCDAKFTKQKAVTIWGSGKPRREFLFSGDCADAIVFLAENLSAEMLETSSIGTGGWSHVNIGSGDEVTIRELAETVADVVGFKGDLEFDSEKPDGTPRKLLDSSFLRGLGWSPKMTLREGLQATIDWYRSRYEPSHLSSVESPGRQSGAVTQP